MGGDHHHHGPPYKVPDYKIYKVEDAPELVQLRSTLADRGLKDPWLRNEVWRFNPKIYGTQAERTKLLFGRGFKWGLVAALATVAAQQAWNAVSPDDHHGHGEHH